MRPKLERAEIDARPQITEGRKDNAMTKQHAPSFPSCRLEKRTSAKGTEYFSGFLGGARVTLLKSNETGRDGHEVWHLMVAEGKLYPPRDAGSKSAATGDAPAETPRSAPKYSCAKRDFARPDRMTSDRPCAGPMRDQPMPF